MRDRKQADVHVMIMEMYTGSGGTEYTLTLLGQFRFDVVNDPLKYNARFGNEGTGGTTIIDSD